MKRCHSHKGTDCKINTEPSVKTAAIISSAKAIEQTDETLRRPSDFTAELLGSAALTGPSENKQ